MTVDPVALHDLCHKMILQKAVEAEFGDRRVRRG
jgi:hypothetical protein